MYCKYLAALSQRITARSLLEGFSVFNPNTVLQQLSLIITVTSYKYSLTTHYGPQSATSHFSEIKGDVGKSVHEKEQKQKMLHQDRKSLITPSLNLCFFLICIVLFFLDS